MKCRLFNAMFLYKKMALPFLDVNFEIVYKNKHGSLFLLKENL